MPRRIGRASIYIPGSITLPTARSRPEAMPPPDRPVTPVTPAQMRGTVDQLAAYLALARHLAGRGSCALPLAVFDGRRRYDLSFTDLDPEILPGFAGPTRVCRMSRRRIAGFPVERGGTTATDQ